MRDSSPSSSKPVLTIGLCFLVALLEGLDLQATGIAAPHMAKAFALTPAMLGWVFSAGLLGLLPGAFIGGWLADRLGRKNILIVAVLLFGGFSLGTALADSYASLLVARLMTGLGLGAALPILIALASEAAPERLRSTAVSITYCGVPLGGAIASIIGMAPLGEDWRVVFYVGGIAPIVIALVLVVWLKESQAFRAQTGEKVAGQGMLAQLFGPGHASRTLLLWVACFFTLTVLYMLLNWLPSLLIGQGFSRPQAGTVQILFNLGGAAGSFLTGRMMDKGHARRAVFIAYIGMLAALAGLGLSTSFAFMLVAGFIAGYCAIGGQLVLYALAPTLYSTQVRATGVGASVAIGRLGSMAGPLAAGQILAAGTGVGGVLLAASPGLVVAAVAARALLAKRNRQPQ
ncbi:MULTISPECIES: 3-(3-hydroxy-phenyl)propionate transporter MhpT [Pseudomonas]|jgi:AAHS family 3-hydroxyphenylpropionic acid transporter|uniref:3-(3-hydroxy-phenyl)propionate transporter MhpT n=2 Tax=Pseudomonas TaxID=286 RepID=A0A7Y7Z7I2_PSEPU|nr:MULTISPECIES: 3-(3-hydroxy-phenyl)propionate transporter MhpT [Pseudomonas]QPN47498.1 3-(3-hydroxy-phenyl)propionate transporter MhpT [Priestia aryabhattai]MBG6123539.1 AAHS family 3-hydroxyphenylpropionic acid transporter [Pseudomonas sp. M2]MBM7395591.1 AAHS family 3-hydroxyphenylpropionic acid transporter [Pseudomonas sp. M5]NSX20380.1 3-(3-hydroxy-phenyl)propionate transporter MhpT [Pseudomonas putida]NWC79762.1 3-(3-hydroxy-phenyl)propionate transporter MhpT [Pseudomonas putida]